MKPIKVKVDKETALMFAHILGAHQVAVYVMVGGGYLGRSAAQSPADFYIDDRVGARPYSRTKIYTAVAYLCEIARAAGHDPHNLPAMPNIHNLGVF